MLIQNINHEKVIFRTCLQIVDITGNYEQKTSKAVLSSGHIKDSTNAIMALIWRKQNIPNLPMLIKMAICLWKLFLHSAGKKIKFVHITPVDGCKLLFTSRQYPISLSSRTDNSQSQHPGIYKHYSKNVGQISYIQKNE